MSQSSLPNPLFQPGVSFFISGTIRSRADLAQRSKAQKLIHFYLEKENLYGLVLCGGNSSRMGEDKSFLSYHNKPQCYHIYEMLQQFCKQTFISCNAEQSIRIESAYKIIQDDQSFANRGPATGVLTAFSSHPQKDLLVIACDYPLFYAAEIDHFIKNIPGKSIAAAFYNADEECYVPVLAWYSAAAGCMLLQSSQLSLQQLLQRLNAYKHAPINSDSMQSVDTKEESEKVMHLTNKNR